MKRFWESRFWRRTVHFVTTIQDMQVRLYAANAGYFMVLSLFPALVLILSLLRYTGLQPDTFLEVLEGLLPQALIPTARAFIAGTYANTSGFVISFSAVISLWSASKGFFGLMTGLNAIYDVSEDRSFVRTRLISVIYTILFLLVLLLTLALHVFGTTILEWIPAGATRFLAVLDSMISLRFLLLLLTQTALFTAMFMVLPNRKNTLRQSLPGALLSSAGWLIFSDLYSIYVEHFAGLSSIYGSVYAIALSMLWLYCCLSILFYGGALNHYLMDHT